MTGRDTAPGTIRARERYHHGDLRAALIEAGLELTRAGGPGALGLREATRRVGVSPNAAYRHFADRQALMSAVSEAVEERMAARMRSGTRRSAMSDSPTDRARTQLRSVGLGYIRFALAEPGWFSVTFFGETAPPPIGANSTAEPVETTDTGHVPAPFILLVDALDGLVSAGVITPTQRLGAEWPCFSAVHGFAVLALHGPLQHQSRSALDRLAGRTVDDIITGVTDPGAT